MKKPGLHTLLQILDEMEHKELCPLLEKVKIPQKTQKQKIKRTAEKSR